VPLSEAAPQSADDAEALAAKQTDELLPQGVTTPGMLLLAAEALEGDVVAPNAQALGSDHEHLV
jgi:hypothetical protein